ncbi:MAG TPA: glycosyltransferase family 4 protein, partial [Dehalococcoidia bacterium]|nr:glycosyltransferase family 4 protein [Dehalococcoidia bacterium]
MRIAQIAPIQESVPPKGYGGTERVVSWLTEELVRRGHDVTLFATGDSETSATLVPVVPRALRPAGVTDFLPATMLSLGMAFDRAHEFDVIHSHVDVPAIPFARLVRTPVLFTMHGRLDLPWFRTLYDAYPDANLASVSNNQRRLLPRWNWLGTVYNGIDVDDYTFHPHAGDYLAFLGRISDEKGVEEAIAVARMTGIPLKIAAKVDPRDREYYESVRHLLEAPGVEFIGEIDQRQKDAFLGQACALIFPIRWPEPFGLVMIEAMATGTPVIAGRFGSVPEVLDDGVTGFICDSNEEMALAIERVHELDRARCRAVVEERFSASSMADGYEAMY